MGWSDLGGFMGTMGSLGTLGLGAATGGSSLLGGLVGNVAGNLINSAISGHFARQNMEKQLNLQKELFEFENSNKHQFEVADLRAAGLNPILSATNGNAVGVGGIGISNPISSENPYSSAKQFELAKGQLGIEKQNADTASFVGGSTVRKNNSDSLLAEANANTAIKMLPLLERQKEGQISNEKLVADSEAARNYAVGSAAQVTASANAARATQDILESRERTLGYEGQRTEVKYRAQGYNLSNWEKQHYLDVRYGNQPASSALDFWNLIHGK